ncbi:hypothetical protein EXN66_Car001789 [Channa argus]|uniref:Uncharacterized protein n=1 Tax=Channa argus TaxID=215402 RepID=A0A6G1R1G0_CHAAH|nr:hypothetical protein EXN66_Car001789 [Channa argus]
MAALSAKSYRNITQTELFCTHGAQHLRERWSKGRWVDSDLWLVSAGQTVVVGGRRPCRLLPTPL